MSNQLRAGAGLFLIELLLFLAPLGCHRSDRLDAQSGSCMALLRQVAERDVTSEDVTQELSRLPSDLRERFSSDEGRRDLSQSISDRHLMIREALRRKLDQDPQFQRDVTGFEEKLLLKLLVEAEEKTAGEPPEVELRRWYTEHQSDFKEPERLRLDRILVTASSKGTSARADARRRAETLLRRIRAGEAFERVASSGDGPEKSRGGDWGLFASGELHDAALEQAALELREPLHPIGVIETKEGFAILRLKERKPARLRAFEEVRSKVINALLPTRKRQSFDALLLRLRQSSSASASTAVAAAH